ncbi:hypothetical protein MA16_Dca027080 [Dendrobium catenatum]|uniref:Uncharacterized protein n=1 Tax=Dendrobium catenatum TaxID=906689 RepID=A0A2I0X7W1_9ASPA|nr:hypothetical protein MA16_Dca027080 [Dendrobium catenatum]
MELKFAQVDGRGKADTDWMVYHLPYIGLWEDRRAYIIEGITAGPDSEHFIHEYLQWSRSWATLYMLKPPTTPTTIYYPRAPSERYLVRNINALYTSFLNNYNIIEVLFIFLSLSLISS